ncbi:hypothetical protein ABT186_02140 [Streptomyces sp. NPDC001634]|uniref:hypothetical protein n=1 Tax=Streptomyces sp. NPDC001634 TaxID=3154390 RepID=UPI0033221ACB
MTRVTLPDNARGVAMDGSNRYTAKPGDQVTVSPGHAEYIRQHARPGRGQFTVGTKRGMRCEPCARTWNAWNLECPRCGELTEEVA